MGSKNTNLLSTVALCDFDQLASPISLNVIRLLHLDLPLTGFISTKTLDLTAAVSDLKYHLIWFQIGQSVLMD